MTYYRCGPIPFFCLLVGTVWGTILLNGGTWVSATLGGFLTCTLSLTGATAWKICSAGWLDIQVYVENELVDESTIHIATVRGTLAVGRQVVVGMPVEIYLHNTVAVNVQPVVLGRALVLQDQQLRAAGLA
jgi:hypothetical protein